MSIWGNGVYSSKVWKKGQLYVKTGIFTVRAMTLFHGVILLSFTKLKHTLRARDPNVILSVMCKLHSVLLARAIVFKLNPSRK